MAVLSYTLEEDQDGLISYTFLTKQAYYSIQFSPAQYLEYIEQYPMLLNCGIGLSIFRTMIDKESRKTSDEDVQETVSDIIRDFLSTQPEDAVLLYHCDHEDGGQQYRSKVFDLWYKNSVFKQLIRKREIIIEMVSDNETESPRLQYFMGCICQTSHHHIDLLD